MGPWNETHLYVGDILNQKSINQKGTSLKKSFTKLKGKKINFPGRGESRVLIT